jgi:fatty acid desaturase
MTHPHVETIEAAERGGDSARQEARKRIAARRDFFNHLFAYLVINGLVVAIWAFTGQGYFWPAWLMGAWGVGLLFHARDVFWRRPITEADIDRELGRSKQP